MKSPLFSFVLLVAALFPVAVANGEPEKADAANAPKPQYGSWGFDAAGADLGTKPGDDFFRYANGTWLDRVQIPADKSAYSLRLAMTDLTEQRLHDLIEEAATKMGQLRRRDAPPLTQRVATSAGFVVESIIGN